MKSQFKAGDKVKVLSSESSPHYNIDRMIGGIFEVKDTECTARYNVIVWNADKSDCWYFHEHELELATEEFEKEDSLTKIEVNDALFRVEKFLLRQFIEKDEHLFYIQAQSLREVRKNIWKQ